MDMNQLLKNREAISDLADGRLRAEVFAGTVELVTTDADARATWHSYHLIGDVLRSGELAGAQRDAEFLRKLAARLQQEPVLQPPAAALEPLVESPVRQAADAANAPHGWKWLAMAASFAAVVAVGWNVMGAGPAGLAPGAQPILASAPAAQPDSMPGIVTVSTSTPQLSAPAPGAENMAASAMAASASTAGNEAVPVMIRDPHLDELLAAHKQMGGTSALQMPSGFLRNATFEGPAR